MAMCLLQSNSVLLTFGDMGPRSILQCIWPHLQMLAVPKSAWPIGLDPVQGIQCKRWWHWSLKAVHSPPRSAKWGLKFSVAFCGTEILSSWNRFGTIVWISSMCLVNGQMILSEIVCLQTTWLSKSKTRYWRCEVGVDSLERGQCSTHWDCWQHSARLLAMQHSTQHHLWVPGGESGSDALFQNDFKTCWDEVCWFSL